MSIKEEFLKYDNLNSEDFKHARSVLVSAAILVNSVKQTKATIADKELDNTLISVLHKFREANDLLVSDIRQIEHDKQTKDTSSTKEA